VKDNLEKLETMFKKTVAEKEKLESDIKVSIRRIHNAAKLDSLLGSEYTRWMQNIEDINLQM